MRTRHKVKIWDCVDTHLWQLRFKLPMNDGIVANEVGDLLYQTGRHHTSDLAFPDDCSPPACALQLREHLCIPPDVDREFLRPELNIAGRGRGLRASLMAMPVASVHLDDRTPLWQHYVGSAGQ